MPMHSQPRLAEAFATARMTAFKPGQSPPPMTTPIRLLMRLLDCLCAERLSPRIFRIPKDLISDRLKLFNADHADRISNGFAPLLIQVFKVKFFECHTCIFLLFEFG